MIASLSLSLSLKKKTFTQVGDSLSGHGDYFWHQKTSMLYVKFLGGYHTNFEIRTEPAVQVSSVLVMPLDQFFEDQYISNLAFVLGIDPSRIKVVSVVAGDARRKLLNVAVSVAASAPTRAHTYTIQSQALC